MNDRTLFYRRFLRFSILLVCLLILAGGIVRSTGSGMGCPDWPKCFGQFIPPTDISQLPDDYREVYSNKRHAKNLRMANYLETLGWGDLASRLRNDPSIREEERFNASKTWIEYLNRLLGAVVGFVILINVYLAYKNRGKNYRLPWLAFALLILVGFQGWLGSIVVSTNLLTGMITFHMIMALIILALMIYNYWLVATSNVIKVNLNKNLLTVLIIGLLLFTIQVALGTQVRESIDVIAKRLGEGTRGLWISELGLVFYIHRSYSLLILLLHGYVAYRIIKAGPSPLIFWSKLLIVGLLAEILSGAIMAYFSIPALLQPVHLILASLIFSVDIFMVLQLYEYQKGNANFRNFAT